MFVFFSDVFLDKYLQQMGDNVLSAVGCYQIEGLGINLMQSVVGDYTTIQGLDMLALLKKLRELHERC